MTFHPQAVQANVQALQKGTSAKILAVVKADGYGHGAVPTARAALAGGAVALGVTNVREALELRAGGITAPILSWLNPPPCDVAIAHANQIELAVPDLGFLAHITQSLRPLHDAEPDHFEPLRVHLQADVGMAREGASADDWPRILQAALSAEHEGLIRVVGIMGHLSHAAQPDSDLNSTAAKRLQDYLAQARGAGLAPQVCHLGATTAALHMPQTQLDMVRIGAGLVGIDPANRAKLRGAMTFSAPVIQTRFVRAGEGIGYDHTYHAQSDTWLALLPIGYADGVPRRASGKAEVSIDGHRYPIVGAVSMDQVIVETGDAAAPVGATAFVWGPGDHGEPTIQEWARWCDTIPHEIVTGLGRRVERKYL